MKKSKHVVLVLVVMLCVFFASAINVKAQEEYTREDLKEYIISELEGFARMIDVSDFGEAREFDSYEDAWYFIYDTNLNVIWAGRKFTFTYDYSEETDTYSIKRIIPLYVCAMEYAYKAEEAADKLLEGIKDNDSLTDVEKALLLHDRLIVACEYDEANYNIDINVIPNVSHNGYGALVNGIAVCDGYSSAYRYLLEQVGIKSEFCRSNELNHVWNIVYIDDEAYHVDVTWDDPSADTEGYVSHKNFLVSSDMLYSMGHCAEDYDTTPESTKFDKAFWRDSQVEFQLLDDKIYYINNDKDKLMEWDGDEHNKLCKVSDRWGEFPMANFNYALLSNDGEKLLFSLADAVYSFDVKMKEKKLVYQPEKASEDMDIYGFTYENGEYICELNNEAFIYNEARAQHLMLILKAILIAVIIVLVGIIVIVIKFIKKRKIKKKALKTSADNEQNNLEKEDNIIQE